VKGAITGDTLLGGLLIELIHQACHIITGPNFSSKRSMRALSQLLIHDRFNNHQHNTPSMTE
jgi:hypothetical protein